MSNRIKILIFIYIYFALALSFFQYRFIDRQFTSISLQVLTYTLWLILLCNYNRCKQIINKQFSGSFPILFIIFAFISAIPCYYYRGQNLFSSIRAVFPFTGIFIYYILHLGNVRTKEILRLLLIFALVRTFITLIQDVTYPDFWFGEATYGGEVVDFSIRSGLIRFFLSLAFWFNVIMLFYYTERYSMKKSVIYLLFIVFNAIGIYLDQSRMIIVASAVVFTYLLLSNKGKGIQFISNVFLLFAIIYIITSNFSLLFGSLQKLTTDDMNEDYIRILAFNEYFNNYWNGIYTILFGNGIPVGTSSYARSIQNLETNLHLFRVDIGIVGTMNVYGVFFVSLFVYYLIKIYRFRKYIDKYLLGYALFTVLYLLLYCPINYDVQSNVFFAIYMYLVDKSIENNNFVIISRQFIYKKQYLRKKKCISF
jgi:hypothetical protein